jgi:hypothetical protein
LDNPAVKFDNSNDHLANTSFSSQIEGPLTIFTYSDRNGDNGNVFSLTGDADLSGRYFSIYQNADTSQFVARATTSQTISQAGFTGTDARLTTVRTTSDVSYSVGTNGNTFATGTADYGNFPTGNDLRRIVIGKLREGSTTDDQVWGGYIAEIIVYSGATHGDQSDNRTAIEANIGEHYGITAIPAADDTVNGYVQTWYDQSGEGRNGEQDTAANQPKIVVNGLLQKDTDGNPYLKFEGSQYLRVYKNGSLSEGLILPDIQNTFSVSVSSSTTPIDKFVCQANRSQDKYYLYNNKITIGDSQTVRDDPTINTKNVRSVTANFLGLFSLYLNSSLVGTKNYTGSVAGGDSTIGATYGGGSGHEGSIYELVFYRTDQSSNRPAIEANIANQYGITLP